jgi:hypothetical protein
VLHCSLLVKFKDPDPCLARQAETRARWARSCLPSQVSLGSANGTGATPCSTGARATCAKACRCDTPSSQVPGVSPLYTPPHLRLRCESGQPEPAHSRPPPSGPHRRNIGWPRQTSRHLGPTSVTRVPHFHPPLVVRNQLSLPAYHDVIYSSPSQFCSRPTTPKAPPTALPPALAILPWPPRRKLVCLPPLSLTPCRRRPQPRPWHSIPHLPPSHRPYQTARTTILW